MRQPKYMTAKFDGTCGTCGSATHAGDPIYWISRGVIECSDCMPPSGNTADSVQRIAAQPSGPQPVQSGAIDFDPAMTWDDSEPDAGASIGDDNMRGNPARVLERVRDGSDSKAWRDDSPPIVSQRFIDTRCGSIVDTVPVHLIAHFEKYSGSRKVGEIDTGCDAFKKANAARNVSDPVVTDSTRAVVELSAARIKRDAESQDMPDLDPLSQTVADLLVTLVNCIDRLDADQCDALRSHANKYSANSASGSRSRLWQSLGRAIS